MIHLCFISAVFHAAAVLRSSAGTNSLCCRSTASRYATIFRATAIVARLAFPFCFSLSRSPPVQGSIAAPAWLLRSAPMEMLITLLGDRHAHRLVRRAPFISAQAAVADGLLDRAEACYIADLQCPCQCSDRTHPRDRLSLSILSANSGSRCKRTDQCILGLWPRSIVSRLSFNSGRSSDEPPRSSQSVH